MSPENRRELSTIQEPDNLRCLNQKDLKLPVRWTKVSQQNNPNHSFNWPECTRIKKDSARFLIRYSQLVQSN